MADPAHDFHSFQRARFEIELDLPDGDAASLQAARQAVRKGFRETTRWHRLTCRHARRVGSGRTATGAVYELELAHAVELEWSWEGAIAFCPLPSDDSANNLYVAMTRARSLLRLFGQQSTNVWGRHVNDVIADCRRIQDELPGTEVDAS